MNTLTIEKALELNVQRYAELPETEREKTRIWVSNAANLSPYKNDREFNAALLPLLFEVESRIERAQKPQPPSRAETLAFLGWAAMMGGGLTAIVSTVFFIGALVVGTGKAFVAGAVANSGAIFWGIIGFVGLIVAVAGYRNWPKKEEENEAGEVPVQNQNIIVNVFTSQSGDVNVNSKSNG